MNILITGGTGFIGSRLAMTCLERGNNVRIYAQENTDAERANSRHLRENGAEIILGSMNDPGMISQAVEDIDVVFHLAAAQHEANISDQIFYDVNVSGTRNILDASLKAGVKKFIHGSTIGVYGGADGPVNESSPCNPENIYGKTKLEGEKLVLSYRDRIALVVIRISETYGPGDRRLLKLFRAIHKNVFFKIGSGKNLHQLIYIDDLVDGMLKAAEDDLAKGEVILLVGSQPISTDEMLDTIARSMDVNIPAFRVPLFPFTALAVILELLLCPLGIQPPLHRRRLDFFKKSFSFNTSKAINLIEFKPKYSFEQGVLETIRWYKNEGLLKTDSSKESHALPVNIQLDKDLKAHIEPFDTFWEAPKDLEKGFEKFAKFYKHNYFKVIPKEKNIRILVVSCGAGYMVELMNDNGYTDVLGIDSDPDKIKIAEQHGLNCRVANAFPFLRENTNSFDLIFAEQEINHLTKDEILVFLKLCWENLNEDGMIIIHSLNGANPITGSEALSQNFNHFNTFTEYSLKQILEFSNFKEIKVIPLLLYIFYENPINYIGIVINSTLNLIFRLLFIFYGKENRLFSKKISAIAIKNNSR